jgi:hypothetical protein
VPFNFFYTSNLAFSRSLYDRGGGFSADLPTVGWKTSSWAIVMRNGWACALRYRPRALAQHHHRVDVRSFCQRQRPGRLLVGGVPPPASGNSPAS